MREVWKPIPSCPGYLASSLGQIKASQPRFRMPRGRSNGFGTDNGRGYLCVNLQIGGVARRRYVNRLVCEAFHGAPPTPKHQAAHANGIRSDNRPSNLSWKTRRENEKDKISHGTLLTGDRHPNAKLKIETAQQIRADRKAIGVPVRVLAAKHGVSRQTIDAILRGERYL